MHNELSWKIRSTLIQSASRGIWINSQKRDERRNNQQNAGSSGDTWWSKSSRDTKLKANRFFRYRLYMCKVEKDGVENEDVRG